MWKGGAATSGTWNCEVCGVSEERTELVGLPLSRERNAAALGSYASWWANEVHVEHEHAWTPIGCHRSGGAMLCTRRTGPALEWIGDAAAPTPELRVAALALARADGAEQSELVRALLDAANRGLRTGSDDGPAIALLRARSPAWDRAIAAVEAGSPR
ncbi:MAG: hypothetical protein EPO68_07420 [Planctomycetota bacterium]|nr:MAG: hypothetical protein EPO68_07420 [Planctomycetota bacterium]